MTGGTIVVLGATGRNFAAGMSGGIAYVLDEQGTFSKYCNPSMVTLEPLLTEPEQEAKLARELWHKGESDEAAAKRMIERHARYTGSAQAKRILERWSEYRSKFVKVFPNEYRRALGDLAAKQKRIAA
jgi:glutamate synthase (NADPH/NADH) large chain